MKRHLILGNGPTGVLAAETIRKEAPKDEILLVGDEREPPYSRMAIPYLLTGKIPEAGTHLRKDPGHYARLRIEQKTARAKSVDTGARKVTFEDGSSAPYDRLLVATGSTPMKPPIPGVDLPGIHPCWTLENARQILALAKPGARVVQMGAGFIGCIILEALAARGLQVTVVEMGDRMVPRMMGEGAGRMIRRWVERKGVAVHTGTRVEAIRKGNGASLELQLSGGQKVEADLVISATGVRPNVAFLQGSGIACLTGVLANAKLETNAPGVYAAGDCAEAFDAATGKQVVSAVQPNAADQAMVAALNMAGHAAQLPAVVQINVLDTLGLVSSSFGQWEGVPGGQRVEKVDEDRFRYLRLEFDQDVLVGANAIGLTEHVGVLRGLVQSRVKLGAWKDRLLADPTQLAAAYLAATQAQDERLAR